MLGILRRVMEKYMTIHVFVTVFLKLKSLYKCIEKSIKIFLRVNIDLHNNWSKLFRISTCIEEERINMLDFVVKYCKMEGKFIFSQNMSVILDTYFVYHFLAVYVKSNKNIFDVSK